MQELQNLGDEEITREIPNVSESALRNLDENGIIMIVQKLDLEIYLLENSS